ncbi:MAG: DUF2934 domain-containing protein [Methylococcaceae bacterium]|jgi:hypothetical protein
MATRKKAAAVECVDDEHCPASVEEVSHGANSRWQRIAELAYCKAEQRGFEPGSELHDWLCAEREIEEQDAENRLAA